MADAAPDAAKDLDFYFNPDSAIVLRGSIVPGRNLIKAAVDKLKDDIATNPTIAAEWRANPQGTLAARGFYADLQTNILHNSKLPHLEFCIITVMSSGCCASIVLGIEEPGGGPEG